MIGSIDSKASLKVNPSRMEQLPLEMIVHILGYLNLNDLANCRLVCKSFLAATYHVKISDVVLNKSFLTRAIWFFTNSPKYCEDPISLKRFLVYKANFNFKNDLKRLHLNSNSFYENCYPNKSDIYFEVYDFQGTLQDCSLCQILNPDSLQAVLSGLRQLKQLEFYPISCRPNEEAKYEIDLPSLEIFVLGENDCWGPMINFTINLNAPQLRVLKAHIMNRLHIRYPKSVKFIYTDCSAFRLDSFENLEFLELEEDWEKKFVSLFEWSRDALISLNFLKEFHLKRSFYVQMSSDEFKELKNQLINIHHEKSVRRGQELRIFYEGVELVHFDKIDEFKKIHFDEGQDGSRFQLANFELLQKNMWFKPVNYNRLMKTCKNSLPPNYFEKCFINTVSVSDEADLELLVNFLNNLKFLDSLVLGEKINLDLGTFFEQLKAHRLTYLSINGENKKMDFNGEVFLKFKALSSLTIPSAFELNLPFSLFKRLNNFIQIFIRNYRKIGYIKIEKRTFFDRFVVKFYVGDNKYCKVCQNFDEIREFLDLVERRRNPVHWVKFLGFICLQYALDFLHFNREQTNRLCNCNLTWYTDMLIHFIKPEFKNKTYLNRSFYIGPALELNLKEQ